jgi:ATPases involved in chromosome partitioning
MFKSVLWSNPDIYVVDTPPSLGDENLVVADLADKIVLVTTPHPASQYDIKKMLRLLRDKVVAVIVNMHDLFKYDINIQHDRIYYVNYDPELQVNPAKAVEAIEKLVDEVILK